ncbi:hypothetical protein I4U23_003729 [Adineta vaga]|nr:hypothetical protein I4U23_003729 [Adineta vaga]
MSNRSCIQTSNDPVEAIQLNVIKVSRHRHNRHHHPIASLSSSKSRVIHTSIRSKSNNRSIENAHHREEKSIIKNLIKRSKSTTSSVSVSKVHPTPCETHHSSAKTITVQDNSHREIIQDNSSSPNLFTAADENIFPIWTNQKNITNDYHKTSKINKKKKYKRYYIAFSVVTILILGIAIMATLLAVLIKPKSTQTSQTYMTTISNPCVTNIFWNKIGIIYAGNGIQGPSLNQLSSPTGIYMDPLDSLYINDNGNFRSIKYSSGATIGVLVAAGMSGSALNQFGAGIRFGYADSNQNVYVADMSNHRVMRWANGASTGVVVAGNGTFGSTLNQLRNPYSVWVDSNSNVYVAEYMNHRVTKWSPGATAGIVVAGGNGQGTTSDKLSYPSSLVYDESNQDLYITNALSETVIKWHINASNGTFVAGISATSGSSAILLANPIDLKLDRWNNIYVVDRGNSRIQLFCNGNSTGITIVGAGSNNGNLISPYSVAIDSQLNLYVSDNAFARVTKFSKL